MFLFEVVSVVVTVIKYPVLAQLSFCLSLEVWMEGGGNLPPPFGKVGIATAHIKGAAGSIAMPPRSWLTPSICVHTKSFMFHFLSYFQPYDFFVRFNFELSDIIGQLVITILKQLLFHLSDIFGHFTISLGNNLILEVVSVFARPAMIFKKCLLLKMV